MPPAIRVTLALNANRNQRTVVVIAPKTNVRETLHRAAHGKLRVPRKAALRIFHATTGAQPDAEDDWNGFCEDDDCMLLVSVGEEFIGKISETHSTSCNANHAIISILAVLSSVEDEAVRQLHLTARSLPGILNAVGQPDLHPGNKFPIGAAYVS